MSTREVIRDAVPERSTPVMEFTIVDRDGVGFKPDTLVVTLRNYLDGSIINGRERTNVLDANGCTVSVGGLVQWQMLPLDTAIVLGLDDVLVDTSRPLPTDAILARGLEVHVALFEWTWNGGAGQNAHEIEHRVQNILGRPGAVAGAGSAAGLGGV